MRVHQLENELIYLHPSNFGTLNEFFTKFKNLRFQLKLCKLEKEDGQLILAILSKISAEYSVFLSTFQLVKLTTPNWRIPTLDAFIQSLTYEHDKLYQMGIIRYSKDQALLAGEPKATNGNGKQNPKNEPPKEKEHSNEPSGSRRSKKKGKSKILCSYRGTGFHP